MNLILYQHDFIDFDFDTVLDIIYSNMNIFNTYLYGTNTYITEFTINDLFEGKNKVQENIEGHEDCLIFIGRETGLILSFQNIENNDLLSLILKINKNKVFL